jgi:hypothetical protein
MWPQQISDSIRVDRGPPIRAATATETLLMGGRLASHYRVGAPDAIGRRIELGNTMFYVDWKAKPDDYVYTVYQLENGRYQIVERYVTEAAALDAAQKMIGAKHGLSQ